MKRNRMVSNINKRLFFWRQGIIDQQNQNTTYRSPQEPDAILSPIFKNLLSISQSPDFASADNAFSTAE